MRNTVTWRSNGGAIRTFVDLRPDDSGPTGVAVDAAGTVWANRLNSSTAKRIDPNGVPTDSARSISRYISVRERDPATTAT